MNARYVVAGYDFASRRKAEKFARSMVVDGDRNRAAVVDTRAADGERGSAEWPCAEWVRHSEGAGGHYRVGS